MRRICRRCPRIATAGGYLCAACGGRERALRRSSTAYETAEYRALRERILKPAKARGALCTYCVSRLADTLDHVMPVSWGGQHTEDNLTLACRRCNSMRGALMTRFVVTRDVAALDAELAKRVRPRKSPFTH